MTEFRKEAICKLTVELPVELSWSLRDELQVMSRCRWTLEDAHDNINFLSIVFFGERRRCRLSSVFMKIFVAVDVNNYMRPSVDRKVASTYRTVRTGDGVVAYRIVAWQRRRWQWQMADTCI